MQLDSAIYVAGHAGLAGSALVRALQAAGHRRLLLRSRAELDLTDAPAVARFFATERPEYVFLAAAKVGGILANDTYPADFIRENLVIQQNVITQAFATEVGRLLFLGSSCVYPKLCPQPMREEYLLSGPLEPTNRPYAVAKIAGIEMCSAFNRQHGVRALAVMPTNLFGPGDNYDLHTSHVVPALLRKMIEARESRAAEVVVWGTGQPRREFLYVDDMASACLFLMNLPEEEFQALADGAHWPPLVNIGCGQDLTIRELAELITEVVGFRGRLVFDSSKPDGAPRKLLDVSRLTQLGWKPSVALRRGLEMACEDYMRRRNALTAAAASARPPVPAPSAPGTRDS
jgi:GDP-L-fucose synthase